MRKQISELSCHSEAWGSYKLDTCYDDSAQEIVFKAVVPDNSWLSIGFGPTMTNTDMISWTVFNGSGITKDLYSASYGTPTTDPI